jgi:hypothetical protein
MRRSCWRWCWLLTFCLLCLYIAFDTLDVDGSELRLRPGQDVIASAVDPDETDRAFRLDPLPPQRLAAPHGSPSPSRGTPEVRHRPRSRDHLRPARRTPSTLPSAGASADPV